MVCDGEARIWTLRSASLLLLFLARASSFTVDVGVDAGVVEEVEDEKDAPPSSSHTLSSLPRVLTLTAFPLGVISALDTEDV